MSLEETNATVDTTDINDDKELDIVEDTANTSTTPTEDTNTNDDDNIEELMNMSDEDFINYSLKHINKSSKKESSVDKSIVKEDKEVTKKDVVDTDTATDTTTASTDSNTINYEEEYKKILKPFKANGKEVKIDKIDDAIALMQMGANYAKKMQTIKPMRKTIQTLENADINEESLNFLIDIYKGDKEAVKKLIKKHNIDPMDLDIEQINYIPKNHTVNDETVRFAMTLDDLKDSPYYNKTQNIVLKEWDEESKSKILANANTLKALHEEIESGRFDIVQDMVDKERILGRLSNVNNFDAYVSVLNSYLKQQETTKTPVIPTPPVTTPVTKPKPDVSASKKAAAPTTTGRTDVKPSFSKEDILSMSDEDFSKLDPNKIFK